MGIRTVAVYSDVDTNARHVREADEAVHIGASASAASYLNIPALLEAARRAGADAVHPGYGFLAERADFAAACREAGLVFIGPAPEVIARMGSKREARRMMARAGVPVVPGYDGEDQSDAALLTAARAIGFPLLVKASAGRRRQRDADGGAHRGAGGRRWPGRGARRRARLATRRCSWSDSSRRRAMSSSRSSATRTAPSSTSASASARSSGGIKK